jgi:putative transposase
VDRTMAPEVRNELLGRWEPVYRSQLHYLISWNTRGRRPVLRQRHTQALLELLRASCDERGYQLIEATAGHDHVHLLIGLRPAHSVASVVRELKGGTGVELLARFPELRVWLRSQIVWDERYTVETISSMRLERVSERLRLMHHDEDLAAAS